MYQRCTSWTDRQIASGKMPESERHMAVGLCGLNYASCSIKLYGFIGPQGDQEEAARRIERCVDEVLRDSERLESGRSSEATPAHRATEDEPDYQHCSLALGLDRPKQALRLCTTVINAGDSPPHDIAVAYAARAVSELDADNLDRDGRVLSDARKALQFDPNSGEAFYVLGLREGLRHDAQSSLQNLDKALSCKLPAWIRAVVFSTRGTERRALATASNNRELYILAESDDAQAISLDPHARYYRERATVEDSLGQTAAAASDRQQAERIDDGSR